MSNEDLIDERFYKRWASIYQQKGAKDGFSSAKEWVRRTFSPPIIAKLRPYIEKAMGIRT